MPHTPLATAWDRALADRGRDTDVVGPVLLLAIMHIAVVVGVLAAIGGLMAASSTWGATAAHTDQGSMALPLRMIVQLAVIVPVLAYLLTREHWLVKRVVAVLVQAVFVLPLVAVFYLLGIVVCVIAPVPIDADVATRASIVGAIVVTAGAYLVDRVAVHDAVMLVAAAIVSLFLGANLGIAPCMVFLAAMCVVDAISVYRSKTMVVMAERSMDRRLMPILVVPPTLAGFGERVRAVTARRDAGGAILGLGDIGIPTMLVVSAALYGEGMGPAAGAMLGIVVGYVALTAMLLRGGYHAGLPPLAGGAVVGCIAGAVLTGVPAW